MKNTSSAKVSRVVLALGVLFATGVGSLSCGSSEPLTKGSFCSKTGAATCDRMQVCAIITSAERAECGTLFQQGCCGDDGSCGDKLANATEEMMANQLIAACTMAFKTFDCTALANQQVPVECGGDGAQLQSPAPASADAVTNAGARAGRAFHKQP
jgi:hypothetical protein